MEKKRHYMEVVIVIMRHYAETNTEKQIHVTTIPDSLNVYRRSSNSRQRNV